MFLGMPIIYKIKEIITQQHQWHSKGDQDERTRVRKVASFKYLGADVSDDGSKPEVQNAPATAALTKLLDHM